LEGGPQFWSDFEDAARAVATRLLEEIGQSAPAPSRLAALRGLIVPSTSVERRQTWSEDHTFHIQTSTILPGHPAWVTREALKASMKALLESEKTPLASRLILWELFAECHSSVLRRHEGGGDVMRQQLLGDLVWAKPVLAERAHNIDEI